MLDNVGFTFDGLEEYKRKYLWQKKKQQAP